MLENILSAIYGESWVILPSRLQEIVRYLNERIESGRTESLIREMSQPSTGKDEGYYRAGSVAVVPVHGTIYPRGGVNAMSGSTTGERIGRAMSAATADRAVHSIVMDINSPGGAVVGTQEAAAMVRLAAKYKPVHAVANHMAASGAYWLASQATTITSAPNAQVGSIGAVRIHEDHTGAMEKDGIKVTAVTTSPFKVEGASFQPFNEGVQAEWMSKLQDYHRQFVNAVAMGRGRTVDHVESMFGQGRMLLPDQAKAVGMIDRVASLDEVIAGENAKAAVQSRMRVRTAVAGVL